MKTKARKQKDLEALTEQFKKAKAAMLVGFQGMTVPKDQELRNQLREAGVSYGVVKNTLARKAAEGTAIEQASAHFKGVTAVALSNEDPVNLSKAIAKFTKANPEIFKFKAGVVEGRVVELKDVEAIASLPSKEELISKVMFLLNCQAQRLVTVLSAVPRNLAIVVKMIGEQKGAEVSASAEVPASAEVSASAEVPASVEVPASAEVPGSAEVSASEEVPASTEAPANGEVPTSGEIPS